ncbi:four-carbon acid sugar kinase family protein [Pedobacter sp. SYSU D00535]|uniref:four-carbon acid sugar kinase family protein n=1 Tax=Pedobacter sp. SYSU D00535 TaxID=2810308 RepID=UPI001A96615C|nr:four-carbon acid sugar kinase family protein [Pedobacter sp. SYSU D00535]
MESKLLIAFYGDDFTGSTDALDFLGRAGIKTVLFIDPPSREQLDRYQGLQAIGVAGMTRAMSPEKMEQELRPAFQALKELNPRHVHYKVCSTFDSSPTVGSIGRAIEVGAAVFNSKFVPLLVAAPALGRHCVFGNLFAKMGIGSDGAIFRLDRHPSMSRHPVTPADESDLRLHLSRQTVKKVGLIDILQLEKEVPETREAVEKLLTEGNEVVLFDGLYQSQLKTIGAVIDSFADAGQTLFSVGSSGVEMALSDFWRASGSIAGKSEWDLLPCDTPLLVVSGSCSPVSSRQIAYALEAGFKEIALDTVRLAIEDDPTKLLEQYAAEATALITAGFDVIIHSSTGNDDKRVIETDGVFRDKGLPKSETSRLYGTALGTIAKRVAEQTTLQRIIIAGGDTSSYAARAMGIEAVEMIAPLAPGAPLCKAHAPGSAIDGKEVNFKGGQVGKEDYFVSAKGRA